MEKNCEKESQVNWKVASTTSLLLLLLSTKEDVENRIRSLSTMRMDKSRIELSRVEYKRKRRTANMYYYRALSAVAFAEEKKRKKEVQWMGFSLEIGAYHWMGSLK